MEFLGFRVEPSFLKGFLIDDIDVRQPTLHVASFGLHPFLIHFWSFSAWNSRSLDPLGSSSTKNKQVQNATKKINLFLSKPWEVRPENTTVPEFRIQKFGVFRLCLRCYFQNSLKKYLHWNPAALCVTQPIGILSTRRKKTQTPRWNLRFSSVPKLEQKSPSFRKSNYPQQDSWTSSSSNGTESVEVLFPKQQKGLDPSTAPDSGDGSHRNFLWEFNQWNMRDVWKHIIFFTETRSGRNWGTMNWKQLTYFSLNEAMLCRNTFYTIYQSRFMILSNSMPFNPRSLANRRRACWCKQCSSETSRTTMHLPNGSQLTSCERIISSMHVLAYVETHLGEGIFAVC